MIDNPDYIEQILIELEFENIRDRGHYYQFPNKDGDNLTACSIRKSDLVYQNYTRGTGGNIFTLCMTEKNLNFPDSLRWIANKLGISNELLSRKIKLPFGGFYKQISISEEEPELNISVIPKEQLAQYKNAYTTRFLKDGISLETQKAFDLRYDHINSSILIPIWSLNGELIGLKARSNDDNSEQRYWAEVPYPKSLTIYGYHQNYQNIIKNKTCVIVEAEKSVMQANSFGCNIVLAVSGHSISSTQAKYIKSLMCDKVIIAFDEGISEEELQMEAKKLQTNSRIINTKIGYVYDKNNDILKKGSKDSPTDNGREAFSQLIKQHVVWFSG